jgi:hypothetical protein
VWPAREGGLEYAIDPPPRTFVPLSLSLQVAADKAAAKAAKQRQVQADKEAAAAAEARVKGEKKALEEALALKAAAADKVRRRPHHTSHWGNRDSMRRVGTMRSRHRKRANGQRQPRLT